MSSVDISPSSSQEDQRDLVKQNLKWSKWSPVTRRDDLRSSRKSEHDIADDIECTGVRDTPTCRDLALEGERFIKEGGFSEAIPVLEAAVMIGSEDYQLLSILWSLLGRCYYNLGEYERASLCHIHDLSISMQCEDEKGQSQAYCNLGIVFRKLGQLSRAFLCFQKQLTLAEKNADTPSKQKAYFNLGEVHLLLGRLALGIAGKLSEVPAAKDHLQHSVEYLQSHLRHIRKTNQKFSQEKTLFFLGQAYELLKDHDKALDYYQQCMFIATQQNDRGTEGRMYCNMGNCLRAIIELERAQECYERALLIADELKDSIGEAIVCANLGSNYETLGNIEKALEYHQQHLDLMRKTDDKIGQSLALKNVARLSEYKGHIDKACALWQELAVIYRDLKKEEEMFETLTRVARLSEMNRIGRHNSNTSFIMGSLRRFKRKISKGGSSEGSSKDKQLFSQSFSQPNTPTLSRNTAEHRSRSPFSHRREQIDGLNKKDKRKSASLEMLHKKDLSSSPKEERKKITSKSQSSSQVTDCREGWTRNKKQVSDTDSNESPPRSGSATEIGELNVFGDDRPASSLSWTNIQDSSLLYDHFGDHRHRAELKRINKMLESNKLLLEGPSDLSLLLDWSGWMLAPKEIVLHQINESRLI